MSYLHTQIWLVSMIGKIKKLLKQLKGEKDLNEVITGGAIAFIYRLATMGVSYMLLFFISRKLGTEGIGVFNTCLAVSGLLVMIGCLGFNTAIVRFISQYRYKKYYRTIKTLYLSILKYSFAVSTLLAVVLFFISGWLAEIVFKDAALIIPLKITAIITPLMVLTTLNVEFIRGLKKVQISEYLRNLNLMIVTFIGTFVLSYYVLTPKDPLLFYALGAFISALVGFFVIWKFFRREGNAPEVQNEPEFSFKGHLIIAMPMIVTAFVQLLNGKIDTLMLASFSTTATVGIFSMAFKLSVITNFVIAALKTIAMPKISELFWKNQREDLNRVIHFSTLLIFSFAFPVSLVLLLFPEFILGLIQEDFVRGAAVLRIFALMQLINSASGMVAVFLNMSGNQLFFTKLVSVTTVANIVLNFLMIPRYGMEGAAIATLISTVTWNLVGVIFIYKRYGIQSFFNPFVFVTSKR